MRRIAAQIVLEIPGAKLVNHTELCVTDVGLPVKRAITLFVEFVSESASIAKIVFVKIALWIINPVTVAMPNVWSSDVEILRWS